MNEFYPTHEEIAYVVRNNLHKSYEELSHLLGVDETYLKEVMTEKNLKLSEELS